jgi:hypothetical protein
MTTQKNEPTGQQPVLTQDSENDQANRVNIILVQILQTIKSQKSADIAYDLIKTDTQQPNRQLLWPADALARLTPQTDGGA